MNKCYQLSLILVLATGFISSSFSQEYSSVAVEKNSISKTLQQNMKISLEDIHSIDTISRDELGMLSLLFNSVDIKNKDSIINKAIIEKLSSNNLHICSVLISMYFNDFSQLGHRTKKEDFVMLIELNSKIQSLKYKDIYEKGFSNLFKKSRQNYTLFLDKIENNKEKVLNMLLNQTSMFMNSPSSQLASIFKANSHIISLDKSGGLNELYNELIINDLIKYITEEDLVLESKSLSYKKNGSMVWNGTYINKASNCNAAPYTISNSLETIGGYVNSCDPGNYSDGGMASSSPYLKMDGNNTIAGFDLQATGGYACDNYMGSKRNCRDYTSTANINVKGKRTLNKCNNLYKCNIIEYFSFFKKQTINGSEEASKKFKLLIDDNASNNKYGHLFTTNERSVGISINESISHTGGSGKNTNKDQVTLQVFPGSTGYFRLSFPEKRMDFSQNPDAYSAISVENSFIYLDKSSEKGLGEIHNSLVAHKGATQKDPKYAITETALIYNLLAQRKKLKKLPTVYKEVYKIAQQSVSNRLREFRLPMLETKVKGLHSQILSQYVRTPILKILEKLINDEKNIEQIFNENIEILNSLMPGQSFDQIDSEFKMALLESLYKSNIQNRNKLINKLEKSILELSLYRDTIDEEDQLVKIKELM